MEYLDSDALRKIEAEKIGFRKVMDRYFFNKCYKRPRILSICCGIANEGHLLLERFEDAEMLGLEVDERLVDLSRSLGRRFVKQGDVRALEKYIEGEYDVVIGRNVPLNPNYNSPYERLSDPWPGVFEDLVRYMGKGSMLFLTLARLDEFLRAQKVLDNIGYRITARGRNRVMVPSDGIGIKGADVKDNYIVVASPSVQLRLF